MKNAWYIFNQINISYHGFEVLYISDHFVQVGNKKAENLQKRIIKLIHVFICFNFKFLNLYQILLCNF